MRARTSVLNVVSEFKNLPLTTGNGLFVKFPKFFPVTSGPKATVAGNFKIILQIPKHSVVHYKGSEMALFTSLKNNNSLAESISVRSSNGVKTLGVSTPISMILENNRLSCSGLTTISSRSLDKTNWQLYDMKYVAGYTEVNKGEYEFCVGYNKSIEVPEGKELFVAKDSIVAVQSSTVALHKIEPQVRLYKVIKKGVLGTAKIFKYFWNIRVVQWLRKLSFWNTLNLKRILNDNDLKLFDKYIFQNFQKTRDFVLSLWIKTLKLFSTDKLNLLRIKGPAVILVKK